MWVHKTKFGMQTLLYKCINSSHMARLKIEKKTFLSQFNATSPQKWKVWSINMGDKKIKEGKMKKSGFCQQAQMREDIIEVFDLQSVNWWCTIAGLGLLWRRKEQLMMKDRSGRSENVGRMRTMWVRITSDVRVWEVRNMKVKYFYNQQYFRRIYQTHRSGFLFRECIFEVSCLQARVELCGSVLHLDLHLSPSLVVYASLWVSNQSYPSRNHFNGVSYLWLWLIFAKCCYCPDCDEH